MDGGAAAAMKIFAGGSAPAPSAAAAASGGASASKTTKESRAADGFICLKEQVPIAAAQLSLPKLGGFKCCRHPRVE